MDPKLAASGGNVEYQTDPTQQLTDTALPTNARRADYGPNVVVNGRLTMARGRYITTKVVPRRARMSGAGLSRGRIF